MSTDPNAPADERLVSSVAAFVAADRAKRWRYDETLGAETLTTWLGHQAADPNLLADLSVALSAAQTHLAAENARLRQQRNEAQSKADVAASEWEAMLASLEVSRTQRDEARDQRDALAAEVEQIATDCTQHWGEGSIVARRLREAIAKTTPQPPTESQPEAERVPLRKRSPHQGAMTPLMWDIAEIIDAWRAEEWPRLIEDVAHQIVLDCDLGDGDDWQALVAERDAAVKARDENWTECNRLRRDLAEARGETERVRRDYRAYNQRLRDGVAAIAHRIHEALNARADYTRSMILDDLRALFADTAQAAAGTTRDNNGGSE